MAWTLCTSGAAIARAGANVNSNIVSYTGTYLTILDEWSNEAEGQVQAETGMNFTSNINSFALSGAVKTACAACIAQKIIGYDVTGYLSREADTLLNVNDYDYKTAIRNLKDFKNTELQSPL